MKEDRFRTDSADSQATNVQPIPAEHFDLEEYADYAAALEARCKAFQEKESGVLVYRRMRVREVFAEDCADPVKSLEWQLGALQKSMAFKADIPNFLEPWYGIGTIASAFGIDYVWEPGQAPALNGKFSSAAALLNTDFLPVAETPIGRKTLDMTAYFLEKTKGRLPLSYCDIQSPLNVLSNLIDTTQFYIDFYLDAENTRKAFDCCTRLLIDFTRKQADLIGEALVRPGHGFASSRAFKGIGMSDDSITMLSEDLYQEFALPSMLQVGNAFDGSVFHSCGNWSDKKDLIAQAQNMRMADGAFSLATDPGANPTEGFADAFAGSGVVLNARIVGSPDLVEEKVRSLWKPGMKLIVVSYCETPEEQAEVYRRVHEICR